MTMELSTQPAVVEKTLGPLIVCPNHSDKRSTLLNKIRYINLKHQFPVKDFIVFNDQ